MGNVDCASHAALPPGYAGLCACVAHLQSSHDQSIRYKRQGAEPGLRFARCAPSRLRWLGDAAISLGVVVSGFIILKTGWHWIDPAVSIAVSLAILYGTWGLLRDSLNLALHAVPATIDYAKVKSFLADRNGVKAVHDLHIWALSTTEVA